MESGLWILQGLNTFLTEYLLLQAPQEPENQPYLMPSALPFTAEHRD